MKNEIDQIHWMDALERVRIEKVLPSIRGRLLDVGCGYVAHILFSHDEKTRGGMVDGEALGLSQKTIIRLLEDAAFKVRKIVPKVYFATKGA